MGFKIQVGLNVSEVCVCVTSTFNDVHHQLILGHV